MIIVGIIFGALVGIIFVAAVVQTANTPKIVRQILEYMRTHEYVYGLELVEEGIGSRGSIYVYLRDLEEKGWIEGSWDDDMKVRSKRGGRPRRVYRLTESGRSEAMKGMKGVDTKTVLIGTKTTSPSLSLQGELAEALYGHLKPVDLPGEVVAEGDATCRHEGMARLEWDRALGDHVVFGTGSMGEYRYLYGCTCGRRVVQKTWALV